MSIFENVCCQLSVQTLRFYRPFLIGIVNTEQDTRKNVDSNKKE